LNASRSGPRRLEKAMEMGKSGAISNTMAFAEGVDIESINKAKCAILQFIFIQLLMTSFN
jgi:hypothetical protein